jgi:hypothetical protein
MSQPSIIVYSSTDVEDIPMLSNDQTFTGTNTFSSAVVLTGGVTGGASGVFTVDAQTITVVNGVITVIMGPSASTSPSASQSPSGSASPSAGP